MSWEDILKTNEDTDSELNLMLNHYDELLEILEGMESKHNFQGLSSTGKRHLQDIFKDLKQKLLAFTDEDEDEEGYIPPSERPINNKSFRMEHNLGEFAEGYSGNYTDGPSDFSQY